MGIENLARRAVMAGLVATAGLLSACASEPAPLAPMAGASNQPTLVEPAALGALNRMASFLRTLNTFEITASTEIDEVADDGQKLEFGGVTTYKVKRPDRMFAQIVSDRKVRQFYYDGASLTVTAPRNGMFAVVPAPATIKDLLALASDKYGIEIPLADLFRWGTEEIPADVIKGGRSVGYANINGVDTDHYAFRGTNVDWQVWIARGNKPFPAKIVITSIGEEGSPQYAAELSWKTPSTFAERTFDFHPPSGAIKIGVADALEAAGQAKNGASQ